MNEEIQLGRVVDEVNTQLLASIGVSVNQDNVMHHKLSNIVQRIAAVSAMPKLPYRVTIYHTNIVNAAAAPGGRIMVYEGLYSGNAAFAVTDDELAAVLAHEIAHINSRHCGEALTRSKAWSVITDLAFVASREAGRDDIALGAAAASKIGASIWFPSYSRSQEREADCVGLLYMAKAGYDPRAAIRMWSRAQSKGEEKYSGLFRTHPSYGERITLLKNNLEEAIRIYEAVTRTDP